MGIPNPDPEKGPGFMTIGHDAVLPTPRYMLAPGADGYRTPTIEDIEQHSSSTNHDDLLPGSSLSHAFSALTSRLPVKGNLAERSKLGLRLEVEHIHWKRRIRHFTWSYFTLTMATGGIANCLYAVPYRFRGLDVIGTIFCLLNIVFFIINVGCISLRFYLFPETFKASFLHPSESLFFPASIVSFGTILINISQYGLGHTGTWLNDVVYVMFWLDCCLAILASSGTYLMMYGSIPSSRIVARLLMRVGGLHNISKYQK